MHVAIAPEVKAKAQLAAGALGWSLAAYVERLIALDVLEEDGAPAWAHAQPPLEGELPLSKTA